MTIVRTFGRSLMVALLAVACASLQAQDGVTRTSISVGQSLPLTGPGSALAVPFHQGAKLYFDRVNAAGGVNGRKITLTTLDDAGNPAATAANTDKLLAQGVLALFGYYGSPQVTAAYPAIKNANVVLFAPLAGAEELTGSLYPNVYALRPGYSYETHAIVRHAEALGARKFAIMHASDGESLAALETGEPTMGGMGVNLLVKAPLNAIDKVLGHRPESVLVISDAAGSASVVKGLRGKGFRGPIYAYSLAGESLLADQLGAEGAGVVVARVVPKSDSGKIAVVRELAADAAEGKLGKPNVYMLEGYIAARAFTEALRRLPAKESPSRALLRKSIDALDDLQIGGFRVHFVDTRTASKLVELSLIDSRGRVRE